MGQQRRIKTPIVVALVTTPHRFALLNDYLHTSLKCFKLRLRRINRAKPAIIFQNPRHQKVVSMCEAVINVSVNPTLGVKLRLGVGDGDGVERLEGPKNQALAILAMNPLAQSIA